MSASNAVPHAVGEHPATEQGQYFSHLPDARSSWWQENRGANYKAAANAPPPALFLPLDRLLATQTIDATLNARIKSTKEQSAAVLSSVGDITSGGSLLEPRRSITSTGGGSAGAARAGSTASQAPSVGASQTPGAVPASTPTSNGGQQGATAAPTARSNPWDDESSTHSLTDRGSSGKQQGGVWDTAVANALAAMELPTEAPSPSSTSQLTVQQLQAQLHQLQAQQQQQQQAHLDANAAVQPTLLQLQAQVQQLQLLAQKKEELRALMAKLGMPTPLSPTSSSSTAISPQPQAPLEELQRANLKRSTSITQRQQGSSVSPLLAGMPMGMSMNSHPVVGTSSSDIASMDGQSVASGAAGSRRMLKASSTNGRRGAYPEFVLQSANARTSDSQSLDGRSSAPASSATTSASPGGREKRHTHTSGMMEEPFAGAPMARGFAAINSFKRRESPSPPAAAAAVAGSPSPGRVHPLQLEAGNVTIADRGRVLSHSLSSSASMWQANNGVGGGANGAGPALFPAYVRPGAAEGSGRDGRGQASQDPAGRSRHLPIQEEGEDEGLLSTNPSGSNTPQPVAAAAPTPAPQPETETAASQAAITPAPAIQKESQTPVVSGGDVLDLDVLMGGGSSSAGGASVTSPPRAMLRQPSFGPAVGSGKFRVRTHILEGGSPGAWAPVQPGGLTGAAGVADGSPRMASHGSAGDLLPEERQRPIRAQQSLSRAAQRSALGSHQIEITLQDFKPPLK